MDLPQFVGQFPKFAEYTRKSKILVFAYYLRRHQAKTEFGTRAIRGCFQDAMLRVPGDLSLLLRTLATGRDAPLIRSTRQGRYSLSIHGLQEVEGILPSSQKELSSFLEGAIPHLQKSIAKVKDEERREYLAEAIACLGAEARRATIVMTWLATLDHLYEYVLAKKLADFQAALGRRTDKLKNLTISDKDDFGEMREVIFIEVCRSAQIVSNDVRKILDEKLGIRNSCAHPSTIVIQDSKVINFIEDVVDNVIAKYEY